jgi:hypothetical protein
MRLAKIPDEGYTGIMKVFINGFTKGISSLTLFPNIPRRSLSPGNAWTSIGRGFQAVGDNIRKAMYEQPPRKEPEQQG